MFKIYLFSDFHQVTTDDLNCFSRVLTPERKDRADAQKFWEARTATVIGELLLRYGLVEWTGDCDFELTYGKWGKPYFSRPKHLYFNISHCNEACVCVLSAVEIGIDIEVVRKVSPPVISRVCNVKEAELIRKSDNPEEEFIKRWVMKESYAKLLGVGLSRDFRTIDTIEHEDSFMVSSFGNMYISVATHRQR